MKELIVNTKKEGTASGLIVCIVMIGILAAILLALRASDSDSVLLHYLNIAGQLFTALLMGIFLIGLIYGLITLNDDEPLAILKPDGILVKNFGFIPWSDIQDIDMYQVKTVPIASIAISVYDLSKLSKQSTVSGKMAIFWSKLFKYPPIILSNADLEHHEILRFAYNYIDKKDAKIPTQRPARSEPDTSYGAELIILYIAIGIVLKACGLSPVQIIWISFIMGAAYPFLMQYIRS